MSSARDAIVHRVRRALRDVPAAERSVDVPVSRAYRHAADEPRDAIIERFVERVRDYGADVARVGAGEVSRRLTEACRQRQLRRVVVPAKLPAEWRPAGAEVIEDTGLTAAQLDGVDAAVTGCAVAIAETGTIALDGRGACGRRAVTLVPDHHICVIGSDQVLGSVPEAIAALAGAVRDDRAPITFISGPSASSDIELSRVEGVHGPRHLLVLVVDRPGGAG
jgi:L-lactate dehydrogenase complex protein LldG